MTKKVPTMPVSPEIPAATYTISGGRYDSRISRPSSRMLRSIQRQTAASGAGSEEAWPSAIGSAADGRGRRYFAHSPSRR